MRILITGASGLVGKKLQERLKEKDYDVFTLSRSPSKNNQQIQWNPDSELSNLELLENFDTIVHLAGENIADSRWTEQKKRRILDSRIIGTKNLINAISKLENKPKTFISASAIGIYGNRPNEKLTESSELGTGFLPDICLAWEKASSKVKELGIRLVTLRIGIVLDPAGGALKKMLLPFQLGLGGKVGSGESVLSWISNSDLVNLIIFAIENEKVQGTFNATAPNPVSNEVFTKALAKQLQRPAILPIPEFFLKLIYGEMAKHTILASIEALPEKALATGFRFENSDIQQTLAEILN
jgi:uncharacterized protein (TIGR01777 family)